MESMMRAQNRPKRRRSAPPERDPHFVADEPVGEADAPDATVQSPTTDTGLSVEEQVRKEWDPKKQGGLPTSLKTGYR
jgi:hypothetical protein